MSVVYEAANPMIKDSSNRKRHIHIQSIMQTLFSIARMTLGLGLLAIPKPVAHVFLVPFTREATIACRMAGARDLVLGALLYASRPRRSTALINKTADPAEHPLLSESSQSQEQIGQDHTKRALIAGMVVDGTDVLSVLWCYLEGTLPIEAVATLGGGACLFLGLGAYFWYSVSSKHE
jgi:hypothetical protein